jgi:hypothetical protein
MDVTSFTYANSQPWAPSRVGNSADQQDIVASNVQVIDSASVANDLFQRILASLQLQWQHIKDVQNDWTTENRMKIANPLSQMRLWEMGFSRDDLRSCLEQSSDVEICLLEVLTALARVVITGMRIPHLHLLTNLCEVI